MTNAIGDAGGIALNIASAEDLDRVGGFGQNRIRRIIGNRPSRIWDGLGKAEGSGGTLADALRQTGATIGGREESPER
ncbi:MAG: hypothetical protein IRY87_05385 [Acetobacteraceae bacterium]|nr:hypothetical protein [Acetobacteraceae bacterium]